MKNVVFMLFLIACGEPPPDDCDTVADDGWDQGRHDGLACRQPSDLSELTSPIGVCFADGYDDGYDAAIIEAGCADIHGWGEG